MKAVTVAISQDFMLAFSSIPKNAQKKVMEFVTKFRHDPQSPGINYEKIKDSKDENYRSVRIDQNYRGIILKPETGNVFLLLWVDKHDDAYKWAARHHCKVNPETGTLQIFESQFSSEVEPPAPSEAAPSPKESSTPLFNLKDEQYKSIGVPPELITLVKSVHNEKELESIQDKLPLEAFEALYFLSEGISWEEIERDYISKPETPVDTNDIASALARPESQRRFHVVEDELELKEMLEAPLENWRVYLHPSQSKLINRSWNGPVRVLGGAGTGKTVVAIHRAKWLARNVVKNPEDKILFTTFTANLATDIEQNLRKICSSEELQKIEVKHIDKWVSEFLKKSKYPHTIVYADKDAAYDEIWNLALQLTDSNLGLPDTFYKEEWERIIVPNRIHTKADYLKVSRTGRGVPLNRKQRADIWPIFEELRTELHQKGLKTFEDAALDAADILKNDHQHLPYRSIIVDETQDMGSEALTLIRHMLPENTDDLFLVGDGHQRIYRRKTTMGSCGIKIIGRSRKLKINYRTTEETRKFAVSILEGIPVDDLDGQEDTSKDYRSLMHGDIPEIEQYPSTDEEADAIYRKIKHILEDGVESQDICVVSRTLKIRDQISEKLKEKGLEVHLLNQNDNRSIPGIRFATMHRVKGLEFRYVFITSVNDGIIPLHFSTSSTDDPVEARQRDFNERALLHVASSRAIKKLFISSSGKPSPYL